MIGFFIHFSQTMPIDMLKKILKRKIVGVFHGLIKLDLKDLVG
jgi:hypothetical protein